MKKLSLDEMEKIEGGYPCALLSDLLGIYERIMFEFGDYSVASNYAYYGGLYAQNCL